MFPEMSTEDNRRLEIMEAATRGKKIESIGKWQGATWMSNPTPQWKWKLFDYRIKEGEETIKKCLGFATGDHNLSDVTGVWSAPTVMAPVRYPNGNDYPHKCNIFVEIDIYTHRVVGVSFENVT